MRHGRFGWVHLLGAAVALGLALGAAHAAVWQETFDYDTASLYEDLDVSVLWLTRHAETFPTDFQFTTGNLASVNGELHLRRDGAGDPQHWTHDGPAGAYTLTADVGADNSGGSYNVGLVVGQNNIVFHPGYGGAALRVDGPGGFGNTNVGFTPANNVLHHMQVVADGTGSFTITLTDGANPANTYTTSFTNAGSVGGDIGFRRSGPDVGIGMYDNLSILPASGPSTLDTFDNPFATTLNGGSADVVNGVLQLAPNPSGNTVQLWGVGSHGDNLIISAEVGASTNDPGGFNVGLTIGQNNIVFHPGYSGGALRVEGPGGFANTNVGFTPGLDLLHLLEVRALPDGWFHLSLVDGADATNLFTASFFNPASVGGNIALRRSGQPTGIGLYDNLVIQYVPEPATLSLLGVGGLSLLVRRRSRH